MKIDDDSLHHHCGVVGIFSTSKINIPEKLFFPLFSLQHRGQESAGIAYYKEDKLVVYKDLGMVGPVLGKYLEGERMSNVGIGHVRYSTQGGNRIENAQPIHVTCNKGEIALAHNGNISNSTVLKNNLFQGGAIFQSTSDTELILHLMSHSQKNGFYDALTETLCKLEGAYSMVMIQNENLYAMRDPHGFRPLFIGQKDDMTIVASETCALDILQVKEYRSVDPGEILLINEQGVQSRIFKKAEKRAQCVFELIYFARPDSQVFDASVHMMRKRMGAALAACDSVEGDVVIPVPDSGNSAALGYAEASGIPFDLGLTRNHYAGRSFIMPTKSQRELAVRMKLHPVREAIAGKRIILIDDSLVRGTTSKILVRLMREAGAKEIHIRLSSPEIKWPCYFGIDIPTRAELISNQQTPEEIARFVGADSVKFLPLESLKTCVIQSSHYCYGCFSGEYAVNVSEPF